MKRSLLSILILLIGSCGKETTSEPDLVGGTEASSSLFPGVIKLAAGCTAAKVSSKVFLTAAHCVLDKTNNKLRSNYLPNKNLRITKARRITASSTWVNLTIAQTYTPSTYHNALVGCPGCNGNAKKSSDIALIHVKQNSSTIPVVPISYGHIADNTGLYIMGYGCENGLGGGAPSPSRLKYKFVRTLAKAKLSHSGGFGSQKDSIYKFNSITPGKDYSSSPGASLCPGDSGGPVIRYISGKRYVVGVNAYYSFKPGKKISYTNWHARFSDVSIRNWMYRANHVYSCKALANRLFGSIASKNRKVTLELTSSKIRNGGKQHSSHGKTTKFFSKGSRSKVSIPLNVAFDDRANFNLGRRDRQLVTFNRAGEVKIKLQSWGNVTHRLKNLRCYPEGLITGIKIEGNGISNVNLSLRIK